MSRLQVGGLVMYKPTGEIFELIKFIGDYNFDGIDYKDCWRCKSSEFIVLDDNSISNVFLSPQSCLLPLGDKQTQDELMKEGCKA